MPISVAGESAQRLTASKEQSRLQNNLEAGGIKCSTPHGIKGTIALLALMLLQQFENVLNASRHQRNNRYSESSTQDCNFWCSTPHGIKGTIADIAIQKDALLHGAQRLTASKEQSHSIPSLA